MDAGAIDNVVQMINQAGFPIAAFLLLYRFMTVTLKEIMGKLEAVIEKNTEALTNGTAIIQHCKDINKE